MPSWHDEFVIYIINLKYNTHEMKTKLLHWGTLVLMLFVLTACSNNSKMKALLEAIPADVDVVLVGDAKTVINSAGGSIEDSKVKLPAYISDSFSESELEQFDELNAFLKISGIELEACAAMGNYSDSQPYIVFAIDDSKKFLKAIENEDFSEWEKSDDITCYQKLIYDSGDKDYNRYSFIVVNDDIAYFIKNVRGRKRNDVWSDVCRMIDGAEEESFADMDCGKYIAQGNVAGLSLNLPKAYRRLLKEAGLSSDLASLFEGRICMRGNLTDKSAKVDMKFFDENGEEKDSKEFARFMDVDATIDTDALAYLPKEENFVYAASLKNFDWDSYMDIVSEVSSMSRSDRAKLTAAKPYLDKIDGTVAFGLGVDNLKNLFSTGSQADMIKYIHFTMLCETKEGKAKGLVNDIKTLIDSEASYIDYSKTADGLKINLPETGMSIYVEAKGDVFVLSNNPIKKGPDNPTVEACDFSGKIAAFGFTLPKNSSLVRDLDLRNGIEAKCYFDAKDLEASVEFVLDGEESVGFIENCVKSMQRAAKNGEKLKEKLEEQRYNSYDESYDTGFDEDYGVADSVVADSAAVDEFGAVDYVY